MKLQTDTIIYDVQKIADYQGDSRFDYNSQLDLPDYTFFQMLSRWFNRLFNSVFSGKFEESVTTPLMITIFIIALAAILYYLYKKRPELFTRSKKVTSPIPYNIEEENIHEIDFKKEISSALDNGDYRLATRLTYLQTLRILSDNELIDWQIHKTPTEYLYEVQNVEMKPLFRELTNNFLQVRYGNYDASLELYQTMHESQTEIANIIVKGSKPSSAHENQTEENKQTEGGANEG